MITYDKVSIVVITEKDELRNYFNLFKLLLKDNTIKIMDRKDTPLLETEKFNIRFITKNESQKGIKTHYILNLTQDINFHQNTAIPMTVIHGYLERDEKWTELFE